jgi:DNA-binding NarL/FixJ family response regulator
MNTTVLVVDDHAVVREGLMRLLASHSDLNPVGSASTGAEALEKAVQLRPKVIVLDISLPDMDGIDTAGRMRDAVPDSAVVMLSMHTGPDFIIRALEAGASGYVPKEAASEEIIDAVLAAANGERFLGPRVASLVAEGLGSRHGHVRPAALSNRELEILRLVADGHTSVSIGERLGLSQKTVDTYRSRLMQKLDINSVAGLVKYALQHGLTSLS